MKKGWASGRRQQLEIFRSLEVSGDANLSPLALVSDDAHAGEDAPPTLHLYSSRPSQNDLPDSV
jgi:hypothetical protein